MFKKTSLKITSMQPGDVSKTAADTIALEN